MKNEYFSLTSYLLWRLQRFWDLEKRWEF